MRFNADLQTLLFVSGVVTPQKPDHSGTVITDIPGIEKFCEENNIAFKERGTTLIPEGDDGYQRMVHHAVEIPDIHMITPSTSGFMTPVPLKNFLRVAEAGLARIPKDKRPEDVSGMIATALKDIDRNELLSAVQNTLAGIEMSALMRNMDSDNENLIMSGYAALVVGKAMDNLGIPENDRCRAAFNNDVKTLSNAGSIPRETQFLIEEDYRYGLKFRKGDVDLTRYPDSETKAVLDAMVKAMRSEGQPPQFDDAFMIMKKVMEPDNVAGLTHDQVRKYAVLSSEKTLSTIIETLNDNGVSGGYASTLYGKAIAEAFLDDSKASPEIREKFESEYQKIAPEAVRNIELSLVHPKEPKTEKSLSLS